MTAAALRAEGPPPGVTVAIIIPCLNEERFIARCLDSLLTGDFDVSALEVIIADGMSRDGTRAIVQEYSARNPRVRLVDNPSGRKADALNIGISHSRSDVVMRIDAHAEYARDYISRLVAGLYLHRADNIGGVRETHRGTTRAARAVAEAVSHPFAAGDAYWRTGAAEVREVDTVFCGCYRREVFDRIGMFNPGLLRAQDREFNLRLRAAGGRIVLDPAVRCTYFPRTDLRSYVRWVVEGSRALFSASRFTTVRMVGLRHAIPLLFVLWHILPVIAALAGFRSAVWPLVAPIALYWVINLAVSVRIAWRERDPALAPIVSAFFAATHYAYGWGAILGAVDTLLHGRAAPGSTASGPQPA